ncbi:DUF4113 domain-containing protein [Acinetobacter gyllenbergii]|uniref:DinB/UmuC family translesion DNA polymerase n=1 Tax=Acinetobacter gyllenbergii TaxID=134534 RepID=UPI003AF917A0
MSCTELFRNGQVCGVITAFASSNPFDNNTPYYKKSLSCGVDQPTDNPKILIDIATKLIEKLYVEGVAFKKCGVILTGLEPKSSFNHDLFANKDQDQKSDNLVKVIDDIHKRYGKKKLGFGASYIEDRAWTMRQSYKTPNYFDLKGQGWILNDIQP